MHSRTMLTICYCVSPALKSGSFDCRDLCINGNTAYSTMTEAVQKCSDLQSCAIITKQAADGKFYLRKASDIPSSAGQHAVYSCSGIVNLLTACWPWYVSLCVTFRYCIHIQTQSWRRRNCTNHWQFNILRDYHNQTDNILFWHQCKPIQRQDPDSCQLRLWH